jgi:hypothetical protein
MSESIKPSLAEAADLYGALDHEKRAAVVAFVSYELTISFRSINYDLSQAPEIQIADRLQKRLVGINEIQHQITSRLVAYFDEREGGKSDRDFFASLLKMAAAHDIPVSLENVRLKGLTRYRQ